jgi:hypothetical protein
MKTFDHVCIDAFAVAMYNVLLNVLPAGRALEQNARIPHNDCNCFKVTFLEKAMRLI